MSARADHDPHPSATPPPGREPRLAVLIPAACASAAALIVALVVLLAHGVVPASIVARFEGGQAIPATTNPETTASGAVPASGVRCALGRSAQGGTCQVLFTDPHGRTEWPSFTFRVPAAWLRAAPAGGAPLVAALVRSPYAPPGDAELQHLPVSVSPAFAAVLATAQVTPSAFLGWLYRNVPPAQRPPWAPGGPAPPAGASGTGSGATG